MSGLMFERTAPDHLIVYKPLPKGHHGERMVTVRPLADIESRCGKFVWWMRNGSDIGICDTLDGARAAVATRIEQMPNGFVPPTREQAVEVAERFCHSRRIDPAVFDADAFMAHYEGNGWQTRNKAPMVDWRTAVRSWVKREAGE